LAKKNLKIAAGGIHIRSRLPRENADPESKNASVWITVNFDKSLLSIMWQKIRQKKLLKFFEKGEEIQLGGKL
jgi:hypothetical protein